MIELTIKKFLYNKVGVKSELGYAINQQIRIAESDGYGSEEWIELPTSLIIKGKKKLVVYVTGLTCVTAQLIQCCALNGVDLTLMHYNNATGEYVAQHIFY